MAYMTQHGHLEMEFRQAALTRHFPQIVGTSGTCLALVADWLKEKKQGTNSIGARLGRAFGTDHRTFASPAFGRAGGEQLAAMSGALSAQASYEMTSGTQVARVHAFLLSKGLVVDDKLSDSSDSVRTNIQGSFPVALDIAATFVKATSPDRLGRGKGVCIGIRLGLGGHAVGAYRSHGGTLYFFDPNMGIYSVTDAPGFFAAWNERCKGKGFPVGLPDRDNPIVYV